MISAKKHTVTRNTPVCNAEVFKFNKGRNKVNLRVGEVGKGLMRKAKGPKGHHPLPASLGLGLLLRDKGQELTL